MKTIEFSRHARRRLGEPRQKGIKERDVIRACNQSELLMNRIPMPLRLNGFTAESGNKFDIVVVDWQNFLRVITIIGLDHEYKRKKKRKKKKRKAYSR